MALTQLTEHEAAAYSPNVLAFYGDCVYELLVRRKLAFQELLAYRLDNFFFHYFFGLSFLFAYGLAFYFFYSV